MDEEADAAALPRDLVMGLRLAVPRGRGEVVRDVVALVGIAVCVAGLLFLAALPGAVQARDARHVAMTPTPVTDGWSWTLGRSVAGGEFFAARWEVSVGGRPIHGFDLFAPHPSSTPLPPGIARFPGPGEVVVSPALERLLAGGTARPPAIEGTVIGQIGPDGLLGPDELRFYRGTLSPTRPSAADGPLLGTAATGWGHEPTDWETPFAERAAERPLTVLLLAGGGVAVLVAVGLIVLLARLDDAAAAGRAVALRRLGLSADRCRRLGAVRGLVRAAVAMGLGAAGFLLLRTAAGAFPVGPSAFYPADLTVPAATSAVIVAAVGWTLARRSGRPPARIAVDTAAPAPPRPFGAQVVVLLAAAATLAMTASAGHDLRGRLALGTTTLAVVAVLGSVAVLVPWLVDVVVDRPTVGGDPRVRRPVSRPFAVVAGLLTAVLVLQAVGQADGSDGAMITGARADLVSTAGTAIRAAAVGMLLLSIVGTLLAAERVHRSELASAVLLPTVLGTALAAPVAVAVTWLLAQVTDLRMSALSVPTLAWAVGTVVVAAVLTAVVGSRVSDAPATGSAADPQTEEQE